MTIWVDADSCPRPVRQIVIKAAGRVRQTAVFVANRRLETPESPFLRQTVVAEAAEAADQYILEQARVGDLVLTRDIPLAAEFVKKGITVINDRGEKFDRDSIGPRLHWRNLTRALRADGLMVEGPRSYSPRQTRAFAACFDRELARLTAGDGDPKTAPTVKKKDQKP